MRPESVAMASGLLLAIAVVVDSLELLADRAQLRAGGLFGLPVLVTGHTVLLRGPLAPPLRRLFAYPAVLVLPLAQLAAAAVLGVAAVARTPGLETAAGLAALTILGARMLLYLRTQLGLDGSDQMILVASSAVAAALLVPDPQAQRIALYYLAAQLLLSYAVAGIAKAISPTWRSGRAVPQITMTIGYGDPRVGAFLERHAGLGRLLCWATIAFECSAAVLILAGVPGALVIIVAGVLFHASIAVLMGLNVFLWSFAAAYPALILLGHDIGRLWE
jgi:hypothetical protein